MPYHPNTDLVAVGWLKTVAGLPASNIATTLPKDTTTWATDGFVQVTVVGGTPDRYLRFAAPVVSVDCWAVNPSGQTPPWGKANQLAEIVRAAAYTHTAFPVNVTLPAAYNNARVLSAYLLSEPRRIPDDQGSYARYTFDVQLTWIEVPK